MKMNIKALSLQGGKSFNTAKRHLRMLFILSTAIVVLVSVVIIVVLEFVLARAHIAEGQSIRDSLWWVSAVIAVSTLIVASLFSLLTVKIVLHPVDALLDGMAKLAGGEYKTRIELGEHSSLKEVAESFNSLASELEHTELVRSDFINNFSHEFKTPLSSMKGLIVLLKSGRVSKEKEREYLEIIEEETDRLSMMTTNILNLSKIQNQKIVINKERFNLSEQIRGCLVLFEKRWTEKGITLSLEAREEEEVFAAEELLRQVWLNLVDNAIKFSNDGGEVSISVSSEGGEIRVSVSNEGAEISSDEKERIFHKFYQGDSAHARGGNGIGLSIVKSIVEMHQGRVEIESENGKTVFTVVLPQK